MPKPSDSQFYEAVKAQLLRALGTLDEVQRRVYDYQKELHKEIKIYQEVYAKDGLARGLLLGLQWERFLKQSGYAILGDGEYHQVS